MSDVEHEHIESELTYQVVGCAMAVHNEIGHGLREKTYERAMVIELKDNQLTTEQQSIYPVYYKGQHIDDYIPDLIANNRLIIELKTIEEITDKEIGQLLNYLRITGLQVGLLINFKHAKLEWRKVVLSKSHR